MAKPNNPNPYPGYEASHRCNRCGAFAKYLGPGGNNLHLFSCANCERTYPVHAKNMAEA